MEGYEFLIEKEEMWARMLMDVLKDNDIPCIAFSVHGAALVIKTGMQEDLKVYVPKELLARAKELVEELFSNNGDVEESDDQE